MKKTQLKKSHPTVPLIGPKVDQENNPTVAEVNFIGKLMTQNWFRFLFITA